MKRLFFVLLFTLSALFFSACSSSDSGGSSSNEPAPQDISGKVIIPSAYNTGYTVQVCGDANNSNSCDGETTVNVNMGSGEFSVTTRSDYPLVAEFYHAAATSGTSVSAWNGSLPVLVYTTPAGENTISAFTTMVKNKVDTQPGLYNALSGAEKVKADTGITFDPFNAASYAANAVLHDKVSAVTAGILEYICDTLNITPDTFSTGVILALYNVVYDIVDDIVSDPGSADVGDLIENNQGNVDDTAIGNANNTIGGDWSGGNIISGLYEFWLSDENTVAVIPVEMDDEAIPLPTDNLPQSGSLKLSDYSVKKVTVSSPMNIVTSERFSSKNFNLGAEAKVYTLISSEDYSKNVQGVEALRQIWFNDLNEFKGYDIQSVSPSNFDGTFTVTNITTQPYSDDDIIFYPNSDRTSGEFVWNYTGKSRMGAFLIYFPSQKSGSFVKIDEDAFKLTTADGSVAILFKSNNSWNLATYPILETTHTFFNQAAAQAIIDQWKNNVTPLW
jgi:hypothetical protein